MLLDTFLSVGSRIFFVYKYPIYVWIAHYEM